MPELTHIDESGRSRMVDVTAKPDTVRTAVASCTVEMAPETLKRLEELSLPKGDALAVAQIAGILAAKRTDELIPLCHPINLTDVQVSLRPDRDAGLVRIESHISSVGKTGVEMEALTAVAVAALTVYDMCKSVDRSIVIGNIRLEAKTGGVRGDFRRTQRPNSL